MRLLTGQCDGDDRARAFVENIVTQNENRPLPRVFMAADWIQVRPAHVTSQASSVRATFVFAINGRASGAADSHPGIDLGSGGRRRCLCHPASISPGACDRLLDFQEYLNEDPRTGNAYG